MKRTIFTTAIITVSVAVVLLFSSCHRKNNDLFLGSWKEIYPTENTCYITFSNKDTMYMDNYYIVYPDSAYYLGTSKYLYKVVSEDSLYLRQLDNNSSSMHHYYFEDNNTLIIEQFYRAEATVVPPDYYEIILRRNK